jgi:DNA-binding transcriptional ArsR family regulator
MSDESLRERRVKRLDARSLRALAHPLRVRILGSLRTEGPATASMLGGRLGESSGATSYHLRVLEEHGFVTEDTSRGTARERWWEPSYDMTSWRSEEFLDDPEGRAADQWLIGFHARTAMGWIDEWVTHRTTASPEWFAAGEMSDYAARMTPSQVRALSAAVHEVVLRHIDAATAAFAAGEADEADARLVRFLLHALPQDAPA